MDTKSYHSNQISALINCLYSFGTQKDLTEFAKTVPHMKSLMNCMDQLAESPLKANLEQVSRFIKHMDSFALDQNFDTIKKSFQGESSDMNLELISVGEEKSNEKKRSKSSSSSTTRQKKKKKKKKHESSTKQQYPFALQE